MPNKNSPQRLPWMFLAAIFLAFALASGSSGRQAQNQQAAPVPLEKLSRGAIVSHLNDAISWYRDSTAKVQAPGEPSDVVYQDNAQNFAAQALRLAFQSAKAEADIISTEEKGGSDDNEQATDETGQPNYSRVETRLATQISDVQSQIDALNKQIDKASAATRQNLIASRDAAQGRLELYKSMQDAVQKMATFAESAEASNAGLQGTINTLARSVPEVLATSKSGAAAKPAPAAQPQNTNPTGLIGQMAALYDEISDMHSIDGLISETSRLNDAAGTVRKPLRDNLVATIRAGNATLGQNPPSQGQPEGQPGQTQTPAPKPAQGQSATSPESAAAIQKRYRDLTQKFRSYSDAMVPLAQESALLDQARSNFEEWRRSIARESRVTLQSLLTRVLGIAIALGVVMLLSELWRRLTFRYVREARRRRQFLVLRRFVIGFLFGIVIILGFVTEFSSLATFAGFVTAGIAVGLQTVLLSVAAYFFVIGRYGIRVGDRISISGVTGDVIDIGLVRLYIMELAGPAADLYPTGRIVVFSNSVLFQATTPLFKQLPGADYTWHEVALELAPAGNHKAAQNKITAAVNSVYEKYRAEIERQSSNLEGRIEVQLKSPVPESKLQFGDAGLELLVRYPVELRKEAEIDGDITQTLFDLIGGDPELKTAVAGSPKIRAVVKI
jgi:small-conductance mechanosensitive channel